MPTYSIPNLGNACRLLRFMTDQRVPMNITQLANALKLPRTTCLRIVHTLASEGFLREQDGGYLLGGTLVALGLKALADQDLYKQSGSILAELTEVSGETTHLAVWNEGRALILNVCDSPHPLRAASRPGTRAYANCSATGKVLLAYNYLERLDEILPDNERGRCTPDSIVDSDKLRLELRRVIAQGYGLDDEEYHEGVRCVAAPVRNALGEVCASIGMTAAAMRFPSETNAQVARRVIEAADRLSAQLGWAHASTQPPHSGG